ncbi:hypothetical protein WUBG_06921 [Wuchereria bancrofti]|uniref:Uncharacterized protein n=1 Tax=Wuchereria bancrofti TaxID=6293 RepID=J9B577_WUCBA|nr:hypothetical protein WUBG_06921 [Wuchereria bancrofti]
MCDHANISQSPRCCVLARCCLDATELRVWSGFPGGLLEWMNGNTIKLGVLCAETYTTEKERNVFANVSGEIRQSPYHYFQGATANPLIRTEFKGVLRLNDNVSECISAPSNVELRRAKRQ